MNPTGTICCDLDTALATATLYDANNEVLSIQKGPIYYDFSDGMIPNQVYSYKVGTSEGSIITGGNGTLNLDEVASYSVGVDWMPDY